MPKLSSLGAVGENIALAKKGEAPAGRRKVEKADKTLLIGIDLALWKRLKAIALDREMYLKDVVIEILTEATEGR
jgi:hypothetical protein